MEPTNAPPDANPSCGHDAAENLIARPMVQLAVELFETAAPAVQSRALTRLVGQVYEAAPLAVRSRLLQQLMRPLGVLALVSVANGVFAKIRFRSDWQDLQVRLEDAQNIRPLDVVALADYVQQVSVETLNGLAQVLAASPLVTASAAAAVLAALLMRRARQRREDDL